MQKDKSLFSKTVFLAGRRFQRSLFTEQLLSAIHKDDESITFYRTDTFRRDGHFQQDGLFSRTTRTRTPENVEKCPILQFGKLKKMILDMPTGSRSWIPNPGLI